MVERDENKDDGEDDPPDGDMRMPGVVVDQEDDGEDQVQQEQRNDGEVKHRAPAGMIFKVLWLGHTAPRIGSWGRQDIMRLRGRSCIR